MNFEQKKEKQEIIVTLNCGVIGIKPFLLIVEDISIEVVKYFVQAGRACGNLSELL